MTSDYTVQELCAYIYPTITNLSKMPIPGTVYTGLRSYDKQSEYLDLVNNKLIVHAWDESHHNGSIFNDHEEIHDLTGPILDDVIRLLTSCALAKSRGEEELKRKALQEKEDRTILYAKVKYETHN
jgi:hypothetical protein